MDSLLLGTDMYAGAVVAHHRRAARLPVGESQGKGGPPAGHGQGKAVVRVPKNEEAAARSWSKT
jgi:hypothetical protein